MSPGSCAFCSTGGGGDGSVWGPRVYHDLWKVFSKSWAVSISLHWVFPFSQEIQFPAGPLSIVLLVSFGRFTLSLHPGSKDDQLEMLSYQFAGLHDSFICQPSSWILGRTWAYAVWLDLSHSWREAELHHQRCLYHGRSGHFDSTCFVLESPRLPLYGVIPGWWNTSPTMSQLEILFFLGVISVVSIV